MLQGERATQWRLAELAAEALASGVTPRQIAADWGFSAAYIRQLVRVYRTWPVAADRDVTVPFSLYVKALSAPDPPAWIRRAAAEGWSWRDLAEALEAALAPAPHEVEQRQWEAAWQRLQRRWADTPPEKRAARAAAIHEWYTTVFLPMVRDR